MPFGPHFSCECQFYSAERSCSCILYYGISGTVDEVEDISNVAQAVFDHFKGKFDDVMTADVTGFAVRAKLESSPSEAEYTVGANAPTWVGTVAGETLPEDDAVVLQRRTGLSGRSKRGRIFVPFVPEGLQDTSRLTTAGIEAYQSLGTAMKQAIEVGEGSLIPKHKDFKNQMLHTVLGVNVVIDTCNRRDRYAPKRKSVVAAG